MKRWLTAALVGLCVALFFPLTASAHPGRTDSNGGHYNHSTGDYHYHHGYPAHDHYDMDGNGVVDCPYDFQDKTRSDSNSNNNDTESKSEDNILIPKDKTEEIKEPTFADRYGWIIGLIVVFWMPIFAIIYWCICNIVNTIKIRTSNKKY